MTWLLEQLAKEWAVVKNAPISFAIIVILSLAFGYILVRYIYKERLESKDEMLDYYREKLGLSLGGIGPNLDVADNTITPTHSVHHVSAGLIKNITVPAGFKSGTIYLIPDGAFTTDTTGNISNSFKASVKQLVVASYDGRKWNLLQSPFSDSGTQLSTDRDIYTTGKLIMDKDETGEIILHEVPSGRQASWTIGPDAPTGECMTGSLFTRSTGGSGSTLYVCEGRKWVAK
jgi:hypothetical protein